MIYGKDQNSKRFRPFDYAEGIFVGNLIYASIFREDELERLTKDVAFMNDNNPGYVFEIRKAK